ncbi:hypothetical protein G7K_4284-t1 [Saitoella complicata NRRL Y-17804]|uniref:RTA1 like protein n=1 Tax=Saitoella complicata (strain BCRC 22490 / CBS 7301 / JCM 7358 / NBRC 10748 / NRRL Y-17804) TaxID=698492 RepID=A0A0E9NL58_SAICN|nr:hypothetical protein G7K_4284-t1 [Saitoella complicata NRRL Y-17804]
MTASTLLTRDYESYHFYKYDPSLAAAIIFTIFFIPTTAYHTWQLHQTRRLGPRAWYLLPLVVGAFFEVIGYAARSSSTQKPYGTGAMMPYIIQSLFILLAPSLFAATIYMLLGRLIIALKAQKLSLVPVRWLTKIFVVGDVISFLMQGGGGGIQAQARTDPDNYDRGAKIILGGLFVQLIFFGLFVVVTGLFHHRLNKQAYAPAPARKLLCSLYLTSGLILIRSIFRIAEYAQGSDGYLISHEVFLYLFDGLCMFGVLVSFNWLHPTSMFRDLADGNGVGTLEMVGSESALTYKKDASQHSIHSMA